MSTEMHHRRCTPCRGGVAPLGVEDVAAHLALLPEWKAVDDARRIERRFQFPNFATALAFVDRVGVIAENEGHHPDIRFGWGYAEFSLQTHKIGGLHENDFILATKIDALAHSG
ncbi:MAG: 4a-hydroxytetrahydrobiopterin dehydratase [Geminicoccaceae bacterium]|jgi:4a-hydroxytetrahydrobiopterin dehydratase|nr:4a-hydroxytetrahydrobiopterin dehydratase [Geminicoccaceae bacterium]